MRGEVDAIDYALSWHYRVPPHEVRTWPAADVEAMRDYLTVRGHLEGLGRGGVR